MADAQDLKSWGPLKGRVGSSPTTGTNRKPRKENDLRQKASGSAPKRALELENCHYPLNRRKEWRQKLLSSSAGQKIASERMEERYRLVQKKHCGGMFYAFDRSTGRRTSLKTKDRDAAEQIIQAKNQAERQPAINLQIARAYLAVTDSSVVTRTWSHVMTEMEKGKSGSTLERWIRASKASSFDSIRNLTLVETKSEHFRKVLNDGTASTNVFLRRLHNFALGMGWVPWPVLPPKQWPAVRFGKKRSVTLEEHERIIGIEWLSERKSFYELLWHTGGSQSDIATLTANSINWKERCIVYARQKSGQASSFQFGPETARVLETLPKEGFLFPRIALMHEKHRAAEFKRRCDRLKIFGVTLHSYRYAWAERALSAGYPERLAQAALGHKSVAVHRAYARKANVQVPSLEEFEMRRKARSIG